MASRILAEQLVEYTKTEMKKVGLVKGKLVKEHPMHKGVR